MFTIQALHRVAPSFSSRLQIGSRMNGRSLSVLSFDQIQKKITSTYHWVAFNAASTSAAAVASHHIGTAESVSHFIQAHHPLVAFGGLIAILFPPMLTMLAIDENTHPILKKSALVASNAVLGTVLSPIGILSTDIIIPAIGITTGVSTALALVASRAKNDFHLKYKNPLEVGFWTVGVMNLCALVFPGSIDSLAHGASLYGGLAVFSGLLVADVQEIHKQSIEEGYSPINQSYLIFLDVINLFTRIAEIKAGCRKKDDSKAILKEEERENRDISAIVENEISNKTEQKEDFIADEQDMRGNGSDGYGSD